MDLDVKNYFLAIFCRIVTSLSVERMKNTDLKVENLEARTPKLEKHLWCKRLSDSFSNVITKHQVVLFLFSLLIFIVWLSYPFWMQWIFHQLSDFGFEISAIENPTLSNCTVDKKSFGDLFGTFGDSFGALNTLFSGLAFSGIIISIFLQSKELKATRDEVEAQRKEFEKQTVVFNKQTFENTFFQMLQQHNELIKSININKGGVVVYGRVAIQGYYQSFMQFRLNGHLFENYNELSSDIEKYTFFCHDQSPQLKIFFKSIYQILKFVNVKEENKEIDNGHLYTNILRAQLSDDELVLCFLNCLSEELGSDKFQPLVEHYAFFEHLSPKYIESKIAIEDIIKYKLEAYGTTNSDYIRIWKLLKQRTQSSS